MVEYSLTARWTIAAWPWWTHLLILGDNNLLCLETGRTFWPALFWTHAWCQTLLAWQNDHIWVLPTQMKDSKINSHQIKLWKIVALLVATIPFSRHLWKIVHANVFMAQQIIQNKTMWASGVMACRQKLQIWLLIWSYNNSFISSICCSCVVERGNDSSKFIGAVGWAECTQVSISFPYHLVGTQVSK
jgi:hypothetical protein